MTYLIFLNINYINFKKNLIYINILKIDLILFIWKVKLLFKYIKTFKNKTIKLCNINFIVY